MREYVKYTTSFTWCVTTRYRVEAHMVSITVIVDTTTTTPTTGSELATSRIQTSIVRLSANAFVLPLPLLDSALCTNPFSCDVHRRVLCERHPNSPRIPLNSEERVTFFCIAEMAGARAKTPHPSLTQHPYHSPLHLFFTFSSHHHYTSSHLLQPTFFSHVGLS